MSNAATAFPPRPTPFWSGGRARYDGTQKLNAQYAYSVQKLRKIIDAVMRRYGSLKMIDSDPWRAAPDFFESFQISGSSTVRCTQSAASDGSAPRMNIRRQPYRGSTIADASAAPP